MDNMTFYLIYLAILLLTSVVALVKFRRVLPEFKPMLIFSWIVLLLEITRVFFEEGSAAVFFSENFHYLIEILAVCWIGKRWKIFEGRKNFLHGLLIMVVACWISEKLIFGWASRESWCRILFSLMISMLALDYLHRTFFRESVGRQKKAILLFCSALAGYYLISGFTEIGVSTMKAADGNLLQNLFYFTVGLGILFQFTVLISYICISTKQRFSLA